MGAQASLLCRIFSCLGGLASRDIASHRAIVPVEIMNNIMPVAGALAGLWVTAKVVPVMYRWEPIPGVGSPEYQAKAKTINYTHYRKGIIYDAYDTGEMTTEMPAYC